MLEEDDSDDQSLIKEALSEIKMDVPIKYFSSSIDLFKFLSSSEIPSLILLDYNATPDNGVAVLKKLKACKKHSHIPVVILSETDMPEYRNECYIYGASSFIKKPDTLEATNKKIGIFFKYWMEVAEV
ncbi:MAG: response regulator [Flavisolibacter sp.]